MALGAITQQPVGPGTNVNAVPGQLRVTSNLVVGDSSYPTGGTALSARQLGMTDAVIYAITSCAVVGANGPSEAYYNIATGNLQCFTATGEVGNGTSLAGATFNIIAYGY